ncbi:MAG TPA: sulfate adenylyltransferase [Polyangiaceae bacterium]|nr:sulfate adenylyltransferase [Polyangiaceae bacterium]
MATTTDSLAHPPAREAARRAPSAVPPHGGRLVDRAAPADRLADEIARAASLPTLRLDARALSDLHLVAVGGFSPLEGFLGRADYESVVRSMRLASGVFFPMPITLGAPREWVRGLGGAREIALADEAGEPAGLLELDEAFEPDRVAEAREVYRTLDEAHPGVAPLLAKRGELALGGRVTLLRAPRPRFPEHHRDPAALRALFAERGWRRVVAFQTRNPVHRAHEYLLRSALETVDGLVIHPIVGETKGDDVPAGVRVRCYEVLLERYFPRGRALLSVYPAAMRYAGPREALLHAVARQNYGFSHFIVGRDHAGVGDYYGTYDAQRIFDELAPGDLAITPIFFEHSFYCRGCGGVASLKTCPHEASERLQLSGTRVRELLTRGQGLPEEFTRPEVAAVLGEAYRARGAS